MKFRLIILSLFLFSFLAAQEQVNIITLDGVINPVAQDFIRNPFRRARKTVRSV
ncbi:MAG: hypothetical protein ACE5GL_07330 [Calditrichia bacterium]